MNIEQVKEKLATISDFKKIQLIEQTSGGISGDHVFTLTDKHGRRYVIKFGNIDKTIARSQQLASEQNLAPKVFHSDSECILMEELISEAWPVGDKRLFMLTHFLRSLHQIEGASFAEVSHPYRVLSEAFSETLKTKLLDTSDYKKLTLILNKESTWQSSRKAFTHNDLNPGNLVCCFGGIKALDWASAGLNDPYYDVATISNWFFLGDELLEAYLEKKPDDEELAHYHHMQAVAKAIVGTAMLQHAVATGIENKSLPEKDSLPDLHDFQRMLNSGKLRLDNSLTIYQFAILIIDSINIES